MQLQLHSNLSHYELFSRPIFLAVKFLQFMILVFSMKTFKHFLCTFSFKILWNLNFSVYYISFKECIF